MSTPFLSGRSPYEALFSQLSNYSLLRVFRSACFVLLPCKDQTKLSARSVLCVFLGYSLLKKAIGAMTLFLVVFTSPVMFLFSNVWLTFSFLLPLLQFPKRIWFILIHFLLRSLLMSTSLLFSMTLLPFLLRLPSLLFLLLLLLRCWVIRIAKLSLRRFSLLLLLILLLLKPLILLHTAILIARVILETGWVGLIHVFLLPIILFCLFFILFQNLSRTRRPVRIPIGFKLWRMSCLLYKKLVLGC
ncbi:hypothetical protein CsSME_00017159 [Camellia sinensis var. sinensis]